MKTKKTLFSLTIVLTLIGLNFYFYKNEVHKLTSTDKDLTRLPASEQLELFNCNKAVLNIADPILFDKNIRIEKLRQARESGDANSYLDILRKSGDNYDVKKGDAVRGRINALDRIISALKIRTNNNYVSAYFQHYEPDNIDTWGIFSYLTKQGEQLTGEQAEAVLKRLSGWENKYGNYHDRLGELIAESFTDQAKLKKLRELRRTKNKEIKNFNYQNGNRYEVLTPIYTYNKETKDIVLDQAIEGFSQYDNFTTKLRDLDKIVKERFATDQIDKRKSKWSVGNFFSEKFLSGGIYREVLSQAYYRRRLEFVRDALGDLGSKRTPAQKQIFERLDELLHKPELMPRSDAVLAAQLKELSSEIKSFFKGQKSRRKVLDSFHEKLLRGFTESITEKSLLAERIKAVVWASVFMAATTEVFNTMMIPVSENDSLLYYQSRMTNWINDFLLDSSLIGSTWTLHKCAIEDRQWTVENACLNKFLFSHLSSYFYESRLNGNKDYKDDEEYKKKRQKLIEVYFGKRESMGYGEFFYENIEYLKQEGYKHYAAISFIDIVEASGGIRNSLKDKTREEIFDYLVDDETIDKDKFKKKMMVQVGPALTDVILEFKENIPKYSKKVAQSGAVKEDIEVFLNDNKDLGLD